jgi:hypothetical protein
MLSKVYLVEETPMDPHYPPHVVAVYANEDTALRAAEGNIHRNVREAKIEDRSENNDE